MKTNFLYRAYKILAFSVIILGVIHGIATFTPLIREGIKSLSKDNFDAVVFMSLGTGTSFILAGLLLFTVSDIKLSFTKLVLPVNVFLLFLGLLAPIQMPYNPFAWLSCAVMVLLFLVSFAMRRK